MSLRIGNGFDIHPLVQGRPLILGGVHIPYTLGLAGHSDGDALTHAVIDALLGAAALGDIGMWFPPGDPTWQGANSLKMLDAVVAALHEKRFRISNLDSVLICEQPKLSPFFGDMRQNLAACLKIEPELVSVKATTFEKLGPIGRGEAIACEVVTLLEKI